MSPAGGLLGFLRSSPRFGEGWGSWVDWGMVVALVACVAIVALIVATRAFYRHRSTTAPALFLSMLSLGVLPIILVWIGNFTAVEYAKQERFCASCHDAMAPYVDDMRKAHGTSLSSLHFQDNFAPTQPGIQCYACHASYGVHGTLKAKMQGLGDAYRYITGTYRTPIQMPTGFKNSECLKCHLASRLFQRIRLHRDEQGQISAPLIEGTVSCGMCHVAGHLLGGTT
jgi:cytochrome c nitrite reductase small subunit